jgi:cytochrome b561
VSDWSFAQRRLHWWTAAVLALTLLLAVLMVWLPFSQLLAKFLAYQLHKSFGILVLLLALARLALRARRPAPELVGVSPGMRRLARGGQWLFYALLLAVPVLGWLTAQAAAGPIPTTLFLMIPIPHVLDPDEALYAWLRPVHQVAAYGLLALVLAHAGAALRHHRHGVPVFRRMRWRA